MNPILHELQNKQWVWSATCAKQQEQQKKRSTTGFASFDNILSSGFPDTGMVHIGSRQGSGELSFLLYILGHQLDTKDARFWVFIAPPGHINAEFLLANNVDLEHLFIIHNASCEDALWSAEQCAKSGACANVFVWQKNLSQVQVRKLEVAAQRGRCRCFWFDYSQQLQQNLPLTLSLSLQRQQDWIQVGINKQKAGWAKTPVKIPFPLRCKKSIRYTSSESANLQHNVVNLHN
ncbi:translesion DNA synthesis-associated protein ImuA [Glaciecola sp. 1036]|uniref:translesion DNA synthesis-associated protein ImuA n=1 Tax=Alteromonadaceae TaxID=72275 RepID=UPI003D053D23